MRNIDYALLRAGARRANGGVPFVNGPDFHLTDYMPAEQRRHWMESNGLEDRIPTGTTSEERASRSNGKRPEVLRVLDTMHLVTTTPVPLFWLAAGVWCRGKLTMFGGREKRGKSLVQLALAVMMASGGGEIAGIEVKAGRVLLIDAENGEREIHRRLRAMGLTAEHAHNFLVAEARGFELREHRGLVDELAREHRADLVLLDSFRSLWRGDERDEAEVARALDPLRELAHGTETAYSLVHHAQKGGEEYRGSSAIGACVDWCVMLDRDREDKDKARRRLANPLARFASERPDQWLRISSEDDDGPVSLEPAEPFVREHEAPVREEIEAKLRAWINKRGTRGTTPIPRDPPTTPKPPETQAIGGVVPVVPPYIGEDTGTTPSWSMADLGRAVGRSRDDKTLRRVVEQLVHLGVLHRNEEGRWERSETLLDDEGDV
jgi:hypothetical protein